MAAWMRPVDAVERVGETLIMAPATTPEGLFLRRLCRLADLNARSDLDAAQRRLVHHALYSTYWDCARLGLRSRAVKILGLPPQV